MEKRVWHGRQGLLVHLWNIAAAFILAFGSTGSGKTEAAIAGFVRWAVQFPGRTFGIVAKTSNQSREKVWPAVVRACRELGIPITKTGPKSYDVGWGRFILLDGANVAAAERIQGLDLAGVYIDEVNNLHYLVMQELENRVRSVSGGKIVMSANPDNPLSWFQRDYINRKDEIGLELVFLDWSDNPHLPESERKRIEATSVGAFYQRRVLGLPAALVGLVYSQHTIEPAPDESECRAWYLAIDPAETGTTHALLIGDYPDAFYVVDEWVWDGHRNYYKPIGERVKGVAGLAGDRRISWAVYDSANPDFGYELGEELGIETYGVLKARDDNEGVRLTQASLARGEVRVDPRCRELIGEFGYVDWDEKQHERGIDKIRHCRKHGTDALRYWRYMAEAPADNYSRVYNVH